VATWSPPDWAALRIVKRALLRDRFRDGGSNASLRAASALWMHMRSVRPDWPTADERAEDLTHHVALKRQIDRASDGFARR
jgi:hypothetical protein